MDQTRKDKIYDKAAMRVILQPLIEEELAEFDEYNKIPHEYSDEFMQRINRVFRQDRLNRGLKKSFVYLKKAVVCFSILLMLTLVACTAIKPLRDKVANAFVTWYEKYAAISYEVEESEVKLKQPTVIPEGYTETERYEVDWDADLYIVYTNNDDKRIIFDRSKNRENKELYVDREHVNMLEIDFNGTKAIYLEPKEQGDMYSLIWYEGDLIYCVNSETSKEEMMEFAKNVK